MQNTTHGTFGIGRKIARLVAVSVLAAMSILAILLMVNQLRESIAAKQKNLESVGYVFAAAIAEHIEKQDRAEIQRVLTSISRVPDIVHAVAVDENNAVIASMESNLVDQEAGLWQMLTRGNLPVSVSVIRGGVAVGRLVIVGDIKEIRMHLLWSLLTTLIASGLAAACAVALSKPLQQKITGPIINLTKSIQQVRETRNYRPAEVVNAEGETRVLVEAFNGMIGDIRNRDAALQKLAYYDPLTGLPNRVSFQKKLGDILSTNTPIDEKLAAVFLLDIDNFHAINDALGHSIGDALLMNVAALLNDEAGSTAFVARLGGDEFAVILSGVATKAEAESELACFIASLYQPIDILGNELHITASVGALLLPQDGPNPGDAQRNMDLALHAAKLTGPGRVYFYNQSLTEAIQEEAELVHGLRQALTGTGLEVHFQPIIDLKTGKTEGFEALTRWNHPQKGMISPVKFIPVAEKSGLISALGDWVLNTSCKTAKAWLDDGHPPRTVAVNISAAQMLQAGFLEKVRNALQESGLPAHLLCLELTESLFVGKSMNMVQKLLVELKAMGIRTALDDFGTGYSSLSYLEHLPFDKLKIDRAFIKSIGNGQKNIDLLHGIIDLAHALGMKVVAEGAEKQEEIEALITLNADAVQGYIYAKPSPADVAVARANAIDAEVLAAQFVLKNIGGPGRT
jgi:diguanylate cyclase (GGDEF)-like protein